MSIPHKDWIKAHDGLDMVMDGMASHYRTRLKQSWYEYLMLVIFYTVMTSDEQRREIKRARGSNGR